MRQVMSSVTCVVIILSGTEQLLDAVEPVRVVAVSGRPAPGVADGATFSMLGDPRIDGFGRTAFAGSVSGAGVNSSNDQGIWSEGAGALMLLAREGSLAPGAGPGSVFLLLGEPVLNREGRIAFYATLTGQDIDGTNDTGIWSEGSGALLLIAREGAPAPGAAPDVHFTNFSLIPALNSAGRVAFFASLMGPGVDATRDNGIWSQGLSELALAVEEGAPAPGTGVFVSFSGFAVLDNTVLNATGRTAFLAELTGAGVGPTNDTGVWSTTSGTLALVAREGAPAPGTGTGVNFGELMSEPTINDAGHVAFIAALAGDDVDAFNDSGIWVERAGAKQLIARKGAAAPGTPADVRFSMFLPPVLSAEGRAAFLALLTGPGVNSTNDRGIFFENSTGLALLARTGDIPPGAEAGVHFNDFEQPVMNALGQIAFKAELMGPDVILGTNNEGIWVSDAQGNLSQVARTGETLEVAAGDIRTLRTLALAVGSSESGQGTSLNDAGQVAFRVVFTDNSEGVFVTVVDDSDGDGIDDRFDNCPDAANGDQSDTDADGIGDVCDPPSDNGLCGALGTGSFLGLGIGAVCYAVTTARRRRRMKRN